MDSLYVLIRLPFAILGLIFYTIAIPIAAVFTGGWYVVHNCLRCLGAPFVILFAALIDKSFWPSYLHDWSQSDKHFVDAFATWAPRAHTGVLEWLRTGE